MMYTAEQEDFEGLPSDPYACALSLLYLLGPVFSSFDPGVYSAWESTLRSAGIQKLLVVVSSLSPSWLHTLQRYAQGMSAGKVARSQVLSGQKMAGT